MTWQFQSAKRSFSEQRKLWDALNAATGDHVLLDSLLVDCLLRHFGSDDVLLAAQDEPPGAMALLQKKSPGVWETFQPSQAPLGLIVSGARNLSGLSLRSLLQATPGYALQLSLLHQDPDCSAFPLDNSNGYMEKLDYIRTARIPLNGKFEDYWRTREAGLRKNNDRLRRRMAEKGMQPEFVTLREPDDVAEAIRAYGCLESKGWKAREGTAVTPDNVQGLFYRELLETFCARGEGVIYQLRVANQVVASDICLARGGMIVLLKTSYDEDWSVYSPAFLLREDVVRQLYAEGKAQEYEFYGPLMDYQLRWTDQVRTLYHVTCFRHPWMRPLKNFAKRLRRSR
jgi:Acetyltransferase (GNAT) domain